MLNSLTNEFVIPYFGEDGTVWQDFNSLDMILVAAGLIIYFAGNKLRWTGHLPGTLYLALK
jgi:hypothetical protein